MGKTSKATYVLLGTLQWLQGALALGQSQDLMHGRNPLSGTQNI